VTQSAPGSSTSFRVLIADDDGLCRAVLCSMLRQHTSALVIEAKDGAQALDIIQQSDVDAMFLDLKMPVMDGLEVLAALRADPAYRSLPIIVLSALNDPGTVRQAIRLGITDYLVKPLRPRLMEARLQSLLATVAKRQAATGGHAPAAPAAPPEPVKSRRRVLLVDGDAKFAAFFTGLLEADHEIVRVANGREAARVLTGWTPEIACLGLGLRLPSELELARKLRRLHEETLLFLRAEAPALTGEAAQLFDALLPRTLVPETFCKEFARLCAAGLAAHSALPSLLDDQLREDLLAAARQTLDVTATGEVRLPSREKATVELHGAPGTPAMRVGLGTPRVDPEELTERMVSEQTSPRAPATLSAS
jgi:CheY-like chemotaxis protein